MPTSCCAPGCTHRFAKNSGIHFYRFPKEKERKLKWQRALQRRDISDPLKFWEPSDHDRLCSQHFTTGKPSMDPCHPDYTPSVFIFTPVTKRTPAREERFQRVKRRRLVLTPIAEKENRNDDAVLTPITEKENRNDDAAAVAEALLHLGQDLPQSCDKDNAYDPDVNAIELWIDKRVINNYNTLTFVDNGNGMNEEKLTKMMSFGYCEKVEIGGIRPIGHFGNGFKSGSMRLGHDAIVFTRCNASMSVAMLSQTYLTAIQADCVLVPIVTWDLKTTTRSHNENEKNNIKAILKHSIFRSEHELLAELSPVGNMKTGTNIIIYNLNVDKSGTFELDFESDKWDIRNPESHIIDQTSINRPIHTASPEYRRSLREYCSILYLKPRMKIVIRGKKVATKLISKSLSKTERDVYKPTWLTKHVKITFGFGAHLEEEPESFGLMMYHKNRLIKAYEKIGGQKHANGVGAGVVGVVECDFLEAIHNKQDFNHTDKYSSFMQNVAIKLNDYFNEKTQGTSLNTTQQAQLPDWTWPQCDNCLKWRRLPTGYTATLPDKWYCRMNPDAAFNRCDIDEEPEDDDEALQATYTKTYKRQMEEKRKLTKAAEAKKIEEQERRLAQKEQLLHHKEREMQRQAEELVTSSADVRDRKPTVADLEHAKVRLNQYQQKMAVQQKTIIQLEKQKREIEDQGTVMLRMAESLKVSNEQSAHLLEKVDSITGTSSTAVTSSSTLPKPHKKRKLAESEAGAGGKKMKIKTETGEYIEVPTPNGCIDLTLDESDISIIDDDNVGADVSAEVSENDQDTAQTKQSEQGGTKGGSEEKGTKDNEERVSEDVKPDKEQLDKQLKIDPKADEGKSTKDELDKQAVDTETIIPEVKGVKKELVHKCSQTVPTIVKLASPKEINLLKLSNLEKKQLLLQKSKELDETKQSLQSLQGNIWNLLKIIVPDFDYGNPENIESIILDFIKVNGDESLAES